LVQEGPTSDVPCRLAGTDHRLQPTHRCRRPRFTLRWLAPGGFTRSARSAYEPPREGRPFDGPGHLRPYREASRAFARKVQPRASSGRIQRAACTPVRLLSTVARVSRGVSAVGATVSFWLGPARASRLATPRGAKSEMRPIESLLPTTQLRAPVPRLLPAQRHQLFAGRDSLGCRPSRPGMRAFHDAPHRFGGSAALREGVFLPPARVGDRTSDTPVATFARYRCALFSR
jgi:hypothetical protein